MSRERQAIEHNLGNIIRLLATIELNHFAPRLVAKELLSSETMNSILNTPGLPKANQAAQLMESVIAQVTVTPHKFDDFVTILSDDLALQCLIDDLMETYRNHGVQEIQREDPARPGTIGIYTYKATIKIILVGCIAILIYRIVSSLPTTVPTFFAGPIRVRRNCDAPNTVAITFNVGSCGYMSDIAKLFTENGGNVTFFMNGDNWWKRIDDQKDVIKAAYAAGHQIGSLTWSHKILANLSEADVKTEMNKLSAAFQNILGTFPVYMRPPYGLYNDTVLELLRSLGFKVVVLWDLDPGDTQGKNISQQMEAYNSSSNVSHIVVHHETNTTLDVVPLIIKWAKQRNLTMVTVGQCLEDSADNWYATSNWHTFISVMICAFLCTVIYYL